MIKSEKEISIAPFTYYKIGGVAKDVYFPEKTSEMLELLQTLTSHGLQYFILGGGSNVLVGDGYWDGAVIITTRMNHFEALPDCLVCGSGLLSSRVAEIALEHARTGLEFLYLLPGSIGGALAVNARFDDMSIGDALNSVVSVHPQKGIRQFNTGELDLSYKRTGIVEDGWIICELKLRWKDGDTGKISRRMEEIKQFRTDSQHFTYPSCGCIFKNDHEKNIQAGRLLDSLGLKGLKSGGAEIAQFHANFIVNTGNATARDVLNLIEKVEHIVLEKTGITLEREVRLMGTF